MRTLANWSYSLLSFFERRCSDPNPLLQKCIPVFVTLVSTQGGWMDAREVTVEIGPEGHKKRTENADNTTP